MQKIGQYLNNKRIENDKKKLLKNEHKASKHRLQFSQKITLVSSIFSMAIVVVLLTANFILLWNNRIPMSQETVTAITIYGGITSTMTFAGYSTLQAIRNISENKYADKITEAKIHEMEAMEAMERR